MDEAELVFETLTLRSFSASWAAADEDDLRIFQQLGLGIGTGVYVDGKGHIEVGAKAMD